MCIKIFFFCYFGFSPLIYSTSESGSSKIKKSLHPRMSFSIFQNSPVSLSVSIIFICRERENREREKRKMSPTVTAAKQAEQLRQNGNTYFKKGRVGAAIDAYTEVGFVIAYWLPSFFFLFYFIPLLCSLSWYSLLKTWFS